MVTDFAVEKRAHFWVSQGVRMGISPTGNDVALAATLTWAIQEVDTDLLNGLNRLYSYAAGGRLAFVPILAEKQGSGPEDLQDDGSGGASHRGSCSLALRCFWHAQTGACATLWQLGPWVLPRT